MNSKSKVSTVSSEKTAELNFGSSATGIPLRDFQLSDRDVELIRKEFPVLQREIHGKPLIYMDNAATTLKPRVVWKTMEHHYTQESANIHRGIHFLSEQATLKFEEARQTIQEFLNAKHTHEIIFTKGTSESINLVASSYGGTFLKQGDEVLISWMEHHSNIVPWQMLCERVGCQLKVAPINDHGEIIMEEYEKLLSPRTKMVSMVYISNSLGTVNPIPEMIQLCRKLAPQSKIMLDAAQTVAHLQVDVQKLDCDFLAFSGHKIFGPTGIGVLYGKEEILNKMPPYQGGGDMIESVTFAKTTYNTLPYKFEAGTPHIGGVIGLGAAVNFVRALGFARIARREHELLEYGTKVLSTIPGLRLIGTAREKAAILSFVLSDIHPHDIGTFADQAGIALRTGHHCTQPVMERFRVPATTRASLAFYNTKEEIDQLKKTLLQIKEIFS